MYKTPKGVEFLNSQSNDSGEGPRLYVSPEPPHQVYSSDDVHELSAEQRRRLQRLDPERPWLQDAYMVRVKTPLTELRRIVYTRDQFTCQSCGCHFVTDDILARDDFTYDGRHNIVGLTLGHVVPKSKGGTYDPDNIKAQCEPCNTRLGDNVWTVFIPRKGDTHARWRRLRERLAGRG